MKIYKEMKRVILKEYIEWCWMNDLKAIDVDTLDAYITQLDE